MGHSPQMLLGPRETEGWRLGSPLEPALLPGSGVLAPEQEGGREGELLRTLQITAALNRRCSPPTQPGQVYLPALPPPRQTAQLACQARRSGGPPPAWAWPFAAPPPVKAQGPISCHQPTQDAYLNGSGWVTCRVASPETMGVEAPAPSESEPGVGVGEDTKAQEESGLLQGHAA